MPFQDSISTVHVTHQTRFTRGLLTIVGAVLCCAWSCDAPSAPAQVSAVIVDPAGLPLHGAVAQLRLGEDSGVVEAIADSAGRVRFDSNRFGIAELVVTRSVDPGSRDSLRVPLLLMPGSVDLRVQLTGDSPAFHFPDDGPMARWGRAVALRGTIEQRYLAAYSDWIRRDDGSEFNPGTEALVDTLTLLLRAEREPEVRAALWVTRIYAGYAGSPVPPETADIILREVHPDARIWAWNPTTTARVIGYAASIAAGAPAPHEAMTNERSRDAEPSSFDPAAASARAFGYVDAVVRANPSPQLRARLLLGALRHASATEQFDPATRYYEELVRQYPESPEAGTAETLAPRTRLWVGRPVPNVALPALDPAASPMIPEDLAGPATLVDFWAVWCGPCVAEIPELRKLHEQYGERGFRIVSVSFDASREDVASFLQREPMPWEHAFADEAWGMRGPIARAYNVRVLPNRLLVGRNGVILALSQDLNGDGLERALADIFGAD